MRPALRNPWLVLLEPSEPHGVQRAFLKLSWDISAGGGGGDWETLLPTRWLGKEAKVAFGIPSLTWLRGAAGGRGSGLRQAARGLAAARWRRLMTAGSVQPAPGYQCHRR